MISYAGGHVYLSTPEMLFITVSDQTVMIAVSERACFLFCNCIYSCIVYKTDANIITRTKPARAIVTISSTHVPALQRRDLLAR